MALYHHVHYFLNNFYNSGRARGKQEMFNHSHIKLRNVIKCTFGARFPILKGKLPYPFDAHTKIVIACIAIHIKDCYHMHYDTQFFSEIIYY